MQKKTVKGSVRWRIVLIYFLLVFIAMAIVSVYLMGSIENYQLTSLKQNIERNISESNLLSTLSRYEHLEENQNDVQSVLEASWVGTSSEEVSVVARNMVIAASTNQTLRGRSAAAVLDAGILARAMNGDAAESQTETETISVLSMSFRRIWN